MLPRDFSIRKIDYSNDFSFAEKLMLPRDFSIRKIDSSNDFSFAEKLKSFI